MPESKRIKWQEVIDLSEYPDKPLDSDVVEELSVQFGDKSKIPFELTTHGIIKFELQNVENSPEGQEQFFLLKSKSAKCKFFEGGKSETDKKGVYIAIKNPFNPLSIVIVHEVAHYIDYLTNGLEHSLGSNAKVEQRYADLQLYLSNYGDITKFSSAANEMFLEKLKSNLENSLAPLWKKLFVRVDNIIGEEVRLRNEIVETIKGSSLYDKKDGEVLLSKEVKISDIQNICQKYYGDKIISGEIDRIINVLNNKVEVGVKDILSEVAECYYDFYTEANKIDPKWTKAFFVISKNYNSNFGFDHVHEEYATDIERIFKISSVDKTQSIPVRNRYNGYYSEDTDYNTSVLQTYKRESGISGTHKEFLMREVLNKYWDEMFNEYPDPEKEKAVINEDVELDSVARAMRRIIEDKIIDQPEVDELKAIKDRLSACGITVELCDDQIRFKNYMRFIGGGDKEADFKMKDGVTFPKY